MRPTLHQLHQLHHSYIPPLILLRGLCSFALRGGMMVFEYATSIDTCLYVGCQQRDPR